MKTVKFRWIRQAHHKRVTALLSCVFLFYVILILQNNAFSQEAGQRRSRRIGDIATATLGLDQGLMELDTPDFNLKLVRASQTIAALQPKGANGFDFTPADLLERRAAYGYYHVGDLTLRARTATTDEWKSYSTAAARKPVIALQASGQILAAADLSPTLSADCPLQITRTWALYDNKLVLKFDLKNKTDQSLQLGVLGIPMIFNNIITGRTLQQAYESCSFFDPYIGQDAGYLQVTRLIGHGPALVVVPLDKTPFEAYQLLNEPMRPNQTFEGSFQWLVHSQAYAESEWSGAEPWNPPTIATLAPGETKTYGVKFLVSDEIANIEKTLAANNRPVAVGIPDYILPMDMDGRLFLNYARKVVSLKVFPEDAIDVTEESQTKGGWKAYTLRGKSWGRARLTLTYDDGLNQSISYYVIKPAAQAIADLGNFLMTKQWFVDTNDPFHRSPSVMSYDREANKIVMQDSRVWIAGLGDEGGSGSWLAAAMKEFGQPKKEELVKYEQFVNNVLWGGIQYSQGDRMYGVRKSMFYYAPKEMPAGYYDTSQNWGSWTSWDKAGVERIDRAYNYPHVVAAYWAMYRLARNNKGLGPKQASFIRLQCNQAGDFIWTQPSCSSRSAG